MEVAIAPKRSSQYEQILLCWTLHHILCIKDINNLIHFILLLFNIFKPGSVSARENEKKQLSVEKTLTSQTWTDFPCSFSPPNGSLVQADGVYSRGLWVNSAPYLALHLIMLSPCSKKRLCLKNKLTLSKRQNN